MTATGNNLILGSQLRMFTDTRFGPQVAILAWFYASAPSDENQKTLIASALVVGWFICAYFLVRMQFDLASERTVINKVKKKFFCE